MQIKFQKKRYKKSQLNINMLLFITFSPRQSVWTQRDILALMQETIHYLIENNYTYRLVTSFGSAGQHFHFHIHILNSKYTRSDSMRRHMLSKLKMLQDKKYDDTYHYRVEPQKGRCHAVEQYLDENLQEECKMETFILKANQDHRSPKYNEKLKKLKEGEMVLSTHEFYIMLDQRCRLLDLHTKDAREQVHYEINEILALGYVLYRIREDEMDRIIQSMLYKYGGRRYKHA